MRRPSRFRMRATIGHVLVVLLLAGGMTFTVGRLQGLATSQVAEVRQQESRITTVERLRWSSELMVSAGRGYLLSADPRLLMRLRGAEARFDQSLRALAEPIGPDENAALADVGHAAAAFRTLQQQLIIAREQTQDAVAIAHRFETELLPLYEALSRSVDVLVDFEGRALLVRYDEGRAARATVSSWMHWLIAVLVVLSFGTGWYFVHASSRSYRAEHDALEAARRAVSTRDDLMGIVAHDLRNPLNAIALKASMLKRLGESEKALKYADSIEALTRRMANLVASLLDAATLESGKLSVTVAPYSAAQLMKEMVEVAENLAAPKRLALTAQSVISAEVLVQADHDRVLQVFSNLIGNAAKFSPEGGKLVLSAEKLGQEMRFSVTDSGPGIPPEHMAHLFDRFWKHETGGKKGTGLGLFIARGIIESHGGRIWAESEPGRGATFFFTLPVGNQRAVSKGVEVEAKPAE